MTTVSSPSMVRQLVFLSVVATIALTTNIFALGLITLFASQYIMPKQAYSILSLLI